MLKKFEFGPEAIAYVRERISWGKPIGRHLLDLPIDQGHVIAFLPAQITVERSRSFGSGGIGKSSELDPMVIEFISGYLNASNKRYAVFDDPLAQIGIDNNFKAFPGEQFFLSGTDIYSFVTSIGDYHERLRRQFISHGAWYFLVALTSIELDAPEIASGQTLTDDMLQALASRADHILVGAYDGETVIMWNRDAAN